MPYRRIETFPEDAAEFGSSELEALGTVWREKKEELQETGVFQDFLKKLQREWAIETGIIERLYTWDRGVTEVLIEQGIDSTLIAHRGGIRRDEADRIKDIIDDQLSIVEGLLEGLSGITKTIDSLKITHPHGDHIDEFLLLKRMGFNVRQLWRPRWLPKEEVYKQNQSSYTDKLDAYFEMSDQYIGTIPYGELVGNPAVSGGVSITQFSSENCGISDINNHNGVIVFEYLGVTIVIPGDNEPASWRELLKQPKFASTMNSANIFMASHHGRESGYCADIFEKKPNLCVVSDGRVQDTDARDRYSYHAKGWKVKKKSDLSSKERRCVTTRSDGYTTLI